ncbi:hypothetical protein [Kocuria sp.]|uniref:hypothetical protein n=1 Tax=Kocuria sp. TaxID=1871328 RepID=UPI0026DEC211|nr:hypothetical protein [Kocuria sp.]MDO5619294.1 hypothetical protein [Kocuria sp.]
MTNPKVTTEATDKKQGFALADLHQWAAKQIGDGFSPDARVRAICGFGGQIQKLTVMDNPDAQEERP